METPVPTTKFIPNWKGWLLIAGAIVFTLLLFWWLRRGIRKIALHAESAKKKAEEARVASDSALKTLQTEIEAFRLAQKEETTDAQQDDEKDKKRPFSEIGFPDLPPMLPFRIELNHLPRQLYAHHQKGAVVVTNDTQGKVGDFRKRQAASYPAFVFRLYDERTNFVRETHIPASNHPDGKRLADEIKMLFNQMSASQTQSTQNPDEE